MDDLLKDFITETTEHIEGAEAQLVQFERNPTDAALLASIFRLLHTIKGTSSFLGLGRLEHVAHAAESVIGKVREGATPTTETVSLVLAAIDRIKDILGEVEELGREADSSDADLTDALDAHANGVPVATPATKKRKRSAPARAAKAAEQSPAAEPAPAPAAAAPGPVPFGEEPDAELEASPDGAAGRSQHNSHSARAAETIRVSVDTIERIMQLVSELVLTRNQLLEITRHREEDTVKTPLQRLSGLTTDLQDAVMRARMQPVGRLFSNLPRLVRELAAELDKKIDLIVEGADTELDRQLIEVLRDPLTHIIRNCADHGIEAPAVRAASGKQETGEIRVSAAHEAGQITIDITDDGHGLDADQIRAKLISRRLVVETDAIAMSDEELFQWIFEPGFSTAQAVTSVSGRGVGMDVVRSNIELIGGSVSINSKRGRGSRFSLNIPLTLAIAPALIIEVADQRFALPQHSVVEAVGLGADSPHVVETVQNALVLRLREEVVPVSDLRSMLGVSAASPSPDQDQLVVIMRVGGKSFGLMVDGVSDVQEIVVKPLSASLAHLRNFSGHTILGDGSVVLILDPAGLAMGLGIQKSSEKRREAPKDPFAASDRTRLVVFRAGPGAQKVLPLSVVSRIEMVDSRAIETSDGKFVTLHQGRLMPLLPVAQTPELGDRPHPVLVVGLEESAFGLLVDEIVDIIEEKLDIQLLSSAPHLVGSAEIKGRAVELIDIAYFLRAAQAGAQGTVRGEGRSVLLIDDDAVCRDSLAPALTAAGYHVAPVASVAEAVRLAEKGSRFDAILIGTLMAQALGPDRVRALRTQLGSADAPVIGLTAQHSAGGSRTMEGLGLTAAADKLVRQAVLATLASLLEAQSDKGFAAPRRASGEMAA